MNVVPSEPDDGFSDPDPGAGVAGPALEIVEFTVNSAIRAPEHHPKRSPTVIGERERRLGKIEEAGPSGIF